jgi:hypothetical protein
MSQTVEVSAKTKCYAQCEVFTGRSPSEGLVRIINSEGRSDWGHFPKEIVNEKEKLLRVDVHKVNGENALIGVKGFDFLHDNRIWVPKHILIEEIMRGRRVPFR